MPIKRIVPVDMPLVAPRVTPDTRTLGAILKLASDQQAQSELIRAAQQGRMWSQFGELFQNFQQGRRQKADQAKALEVRAAEQAAAERLKRDEMGERAAERKEAARMRQEGVDRDTAIYTAENTTPGPINRFEAEIMAKFPGTAARVRGQQTLPATVTPGAMGAVSQTPEAFNVLEPSPQQTRQAQIDAAAREREAQMVKDREADNARMDSAAKEAQRHNRVVEARQPRELANVVVQGPDGPLILDRSTSQTRRVMGPDGKPVGPMPSASERMDSRKFSKAAPVLKGIGELSERINTLNGVVASAVGAVEKEKAKINLNDDIAEYEALVSGFTPMIARALGHTGVLTEQDVQSVKNLFPRPEDSKSLRNRKVNRMMGIIGELEGVEGVTPSSAAPVTVDPVDALIKKYGGG